MRFVSYQSNYDDDNGCSFYFDKDRVVSAKIFYDSNTITLTLDGCLHDVKIGPFDDAEEVLRDILTES